MSFLTRNESIKYFIFSKKNIDGRNFSGKITVRNRGGGNKKNYKVIDFFRSLKNIMGKIRKIEFDSNRSAYICLVCFKNSFLSYNILTEKMKIGDSFLISENKINNKLGNSTVLNNSISGIFVHSLDLNGKIKISRAAGNFSQILKKLNEKYLILKLKSKEYRLFNKNLFFTYGIVSNVSKKFFKFYKAGQIRKIGFKPCVRGEAKNPVDHPHGGNTSGGKLPRTPKNKLTKGFKTKRKKTNFFILKTR